MVNLNAGAKENKLPATASCPNATARCLNDASSSWVNWPVNPNKSASFPASLPKANLLAAATSVSASFINLSTLAFWRLLLLSLVTIEPLTPSPASEAALAIALTSLAFLAALYDVAATLSLFALAPIKVKVPKPPVAMLAAIDTPKKPTVLPTIWPILAVDGSSLASKEGSLYNPNVASSAKEDIAASKKVGVSSDFCSKYLARWLSRESRKKLGTYSGKESDVVSCFKKLGI